MSPISLDEYRQKQPWAARGLGRQRTARARRHGSGSESVAIDEAPPTVAFEPQDPADPTKLIVDTGDSESGVAGGSIQMAPSGTQNWTTLPTALASGHLLARFDDSHLTGPYIFRATSCDAVGNCAATDQSLTMPLRLATRSAVSFQQISAPAKIVHDRVLVGWHYKLVRRHGKTHRVRVGGHLRTIRVIIPRNATCATSPDRAIRTAPSGAVLSD
jgi:hypothetical protein